MRSSVRALFGSEVHGAELTRFDEAGPLHPAEKPAVRSAVPKRVAEFAAGRECAREALRAGGHEPVPLPRGADGQPVWPEGRVGSISHTEGYCGAVVAPQRLYAGIGFDVERIQRVDRSLWPSIASPSELSWLAGCGSRAAVYAAILFVAKEAYFKAQFAVWGRMLEFSDVRFSLVDDEHFEVEPAPALARSHPPACYRGRYCEDGTFAFAGLSILHPEVPAR